MSEHWHVDDRRPTWYSRLYVLGMRLAGDKDAFEGAGQTLRTARAKQRSGDAPPTPPTRLRSRVRRSTVAGMTVWTVRPRWRRPRVRVLYLHGGGYVHPLTRDYWRLVRSLAGAPAEIVVPGYPLAPDHQVDEVVRRLLEVGDAAGEGPRLPLVLMGDSAGGALVLVLARLLRHRLVAVVPLCPWLDATLDEDEVRDLEATDPMLAESGLRAAGRWWAGWRDPTDPLVSPLEGDPTGLPPVHLFVGDRDILRPAVDGFRRRAVAAGVEVHGREVTAMFHVWMTRLLPEAARTRRELVRLLRECTQPG